jgi:uncharacterized protein
VRYVWDPKKAESNRRKHRVTFEEAVTVFADRLAIIVQDAVHEDRALIVGTSSRERILVTVYVEQDGDTTRIISAREASRTERRHYEEGE